MRDRPTLTPAQVKALPTDPAIEEAARAYLNEMTVKRESRTVHCLTGHPHLMVDEDAITAAIRAWLAAQSKGATKEQMEARLP